MALNKDAIEASYPLPAYNYKITVGTDTLSFSEVSGLSVAYEKVVYKHGLSYVTGPSIILAQQNEINLTLRRGVVAKRSNLFTWFRDKSVKEIIIDLCDEKGDAVVRWKVNRAMPLKIDAPTFNATSNDVAFESIELIAQGVNIEYF